MENAMNKCVWAIMVFAGLTIGSLAAAEPQFRRLPLKEYRDKMQGGWLGQMVGVGWGSPPSSSVQGRDHPRRQDAAVEPGDGQPARQRRLLRRDDVPEDAGGLRARRLDPPGGHRLRQQRLSALARQQGRPRATSATASPRPTAAIRKFNQHADDIDYQIEADFSGIISPGHAQPGHRPGREVRPADELRRRPLRRAVHRRHVRRGVLRDRPRQARRGRPAVHPRREPVCRDGPRRAPLVPRRTADWQKTWQLVEDKYHKDPQLHARLCCKPGGKGAFSIDAKLNGAYIVMGLLYGKGDPDKTMRHRLPLRPGQRLQSRQRRRRALRHHGRVEDPGAVHREARPRRQVQPHRLHAAEGLRGVREAGPAGRCQGRRPDREGRQRRGSLRDPGADPKPSGAGTMLGARPRRRQRSSRPRKWRRSKARPNTAQRTAQIASIKPLPFKVAAKLPDAAEMLSPSAVHLDGWLGARVQANEANRLLEVDTEPLLAGFPQEAGQPSVDRRARRQMDARRHARLGLHRRSGAAREAGSRRRRTDRGARSRTATWAPTCRRSASACSRAPTGTCGRTNTTSSAC